MVALMSSCNALGHLIGRRYYQRSCLYVRICVTAHASNVYLWWFDHPMASFDDGNFLIHHLPHILRSSLHLLTVLGI